MASISILVQSENGVETLTCDNVIAIHTDMSYITVEKTMCILFKEKETILKVSIPEKDIIGYDLTMDSEVQYGK